MKTEFQMRRDLQSKELFLKASLLALAEALACEKQKLGELLERFGSDPSEREEIMPSPAA